MPAPAYMSQDQALAYLNDGVLPTGRELRELRARLKRDALKLGIKPVKLAGVRYRKSDIDKLSLAA